MAVNSWRREPPSSRAIPCHRDSNSNHFFFRSGPDELFGSHTRHSTIDLTMNTYTHVAPSDLVADIESLGQLTTEAPVPIDLPADLTVLATNWNSLPEHVRTAITMLVAARCCPVYRLRDLRLGVSGRRRSWSPLPRSCVHWISQNRCRMMRCQNGGPVIQSNVINPRGEAMCPHQEKGTVFSHIIQKMFTGHY